MSLAMELCMPLGRFLIVGWILETMSVEEGLFMGVGVNLRPRLRSSSSSLVICSLDMLTTKKSGITQENVPKRTAV